MSKQKKQTGKTLEKQQTSSNKRKRELSTHKSFKLTKTRIRSPKSLPRIRDILRQTNLLIKQNKRIFFGLTFIYLLLNFVLVQGLGSTFSIVQTKQEFESVLGDNAGLGGSFALFGYLVGSFNGQLSEVAGLYQLFFSLITILATVWLTRLILSGESPSLRDGYYKGVYPLVPFILIMLVVGLQLIPALIGNFLYANVVAQGLSVTALETTAWLILFVLLMILSFYMITSSIFALYIVTLPDVRPFQALRSARDLVLHRRLGVIARLLVLPIIITVILSAIFIPLIIFTPALVEPLFLVATSMILVYSVIYGYNLYRGLL